MARSRSRKYYLIAFANLATLTLLLTIWTDKLEMLYNGSVLFIEFLKIVGITILSISGMWVLVIFFRKNNIQEIRKKIKYASILTLIISSLLYINYSKKIIQNRLLNANIREQVWQKSKNGMQRLRGNHLDSLSFEEYHEISKINWYPEIPESAENISFNFSRWGGLQGDYTFRLTYEVPATEKINEIEYKKDQFYKNTKVELIGKLKRVTYEEGES